VESGPLPSSKPPQNFPRHNPNPEDISVVLKCNGKGAIQYYQRGQQYT
jgi:hypothetical protein